MSRSLRRGALAAVAIVFSIASLSACAAGNDAQTLEVKPDNAAVTVDEIKIQNALVITQPKADAEGPAVVSATVFNAGSTNQTIESITVAGAGEVKLTAAGGSGPVVVPAQGSIILGGKGNAAAVIDSGRELSKNAGGVQEVAFRLSETGDVKVQALVEPATSYFEGYGPSSLPKPPAEPSTKPSGSPSGTPGTPSQSATGQAGNPGEGGTPSDSASASQSADH
ncbi:DUF461 domain-containing protein [Streptomyces sp. CA-135486]|uniref:DUF461 domain-containing protein n=1 Tax=Streptomyces sp. CA-135486 TaxID=3240049 RepID=UPI003D94794D